LNIIADAVKYYQVDYILLSHSALSQVGALPYLQSHSLLDRVKIISTSPTSKMASLTLYEYFIQRKEIADFNLFTLQDVEKAFEKVELVSYNEHRKLRRNTLAIVPIGEVENLSPFEVETEIILSAHPNGSAIGGTCWKIEYNK
jgi:cleavage and polyadenylation specificity factor subunit 2